MWLKLKITQKVVFPLQVWKAPNPEEKFGYMETTFFGAPVNWDKYLPKWFSSSKHAMYSKI